MAKTLKIEEVIETVADRQAVSQLIDKLSSKTKEEKREIALGQKDAKKNQ